MTERISETMKQPEDAVKVIMEALHFLERAKIKADVRPVPVVRDRQGKLAEDYTIKDWFQKLNEELDELKDECLGLYTREERPGRMMGPLSMEQKMAIAEESCDLIKVIYSMLNQMRIDGDFIENTICKCNDKTREFDNGKG